MADLEPTVTDGNKIACPWCGNLMGDACDLLDESLEINTWLDCDECEKKIHVLSEVTVTFTCSPIVGWCCKYADGGLGHQGPVRASFQGAVDAFDKAEESIKALVSPERYTRLAGVEPVTLQQLRYLHRELTTHNPFAIDGESPKPEDFK